MAENILTSDLKIKYHEEAIATDFAAFIKVVESRRSVRVYEPVPVPEDIVNRVLDLALLAPNSSNLQPWEFIWVKSAEKNAQLVRACLSQQAAKTAPVLIVCVAKPRAWKKTRLQMLDLLKQQKDAPQLVFDYYGKLVPLVYRTGPLNIFGFLKWILFSIIGFWKVVPRGPYWYSQLREWAVKSTALACENIMLGFRAAGYDSCPMEGFDEVRVKKILDLPRDSHVVMVISAGKRAHGGVYGPQIRFAKDQFIKVI